MEDAKEELRSLNSEKAKQEKGTSKKKKLSNPVVIPIEPNNNENHAVDENSQTKADTLNVTDPSLLTSLQSPCTRASSPHTPPGTPPPQSSGTALTGACSITLQTSDSNSTHQNPLQTSDSNSRTTDFISKQAGAVLGTLPSTDYIKDINNIDLGPRVNDLSKM